MILYSFSKKNETINMSWDSLIHTKNPMCESTLFSDTVKHPISEAVKSFPGS